MNFNVYLDVSLDLLISISTIKFTATNTVNFTSIVIHTATATIFVAPNLYKILTILVPAKQQHKF